MVALTASQFLMKALPRFLLLHDFDNKPPLNEKLCTFLLLITKGNITATDTIIYLLDICFPVVFTIEILILAGTVCAIII